MASCFTLPARIYLGIAELHWRHPRGPPRQYLLLAHNPEWREEIGHEGALEHRSNHVLAKLGSSSIVCC